MIDGAPPEGLTYEQAQSRFAGNLCPFCETRIVYLDPLERHDCPVDSCGRKLEYRRTGDDFYCHTHRRAWPAQERYCASCGISWSLDRLLQLRDKLPLFEESPTVPNGQGQSLLRRLLGVLGR